MDSRNTPEASSRKMRARGERVQGAHPADAAIHLKRHPYASIGPWERLRVWLLGDPIATYHAGHERLTKAKALAVFSSDALSSVAYATQEILLALVLAGAGVLYLSGPIALAIATLLLIVAISYWQTIHAYPNGGGAYIVAKENLGTYAGLVAGAALLIDYVLTVAVSVSSGVEEIASVFPQVEHYSVAIALVLIVLIAWATLRGIRESSSIFAVPTYAFVVSIFVLIGTGLFRYFVLGLHGAAPTNNVLSTETTETLGILLILRAFAAGCTALTGVEAISNGVPAFKAPESENASRTLVIMVIILGSMFLGITYLANLYPVVPEANKETIISQLGRTAFGASWFGYLPYLFTQVSTTLILVLAANTSFADFPRLASLMSQDRFMPHAFVYVGQRLVFTTGILALSFFAGLLIFLFHASTHNLIPLYAVGVFISFTLSQAGMVRHWYHLREKNWRRNLVINAIGALATFIVLCVIIEAKFVEGAWMVVLLIPLLMGGFQLIKNHYTAYHAQVTRSQDDLVTRTNLIIVPIARMDPLTLRTLTFARTIEGEVTAVFIAKDNREHQQMEQEWQAAKLPTPLRVIDSPFRSVTGPLVNYIDHVHETHPDANIVIVVPEVVTRHFWHRFLHNQTAQLLKLILLFRPQHIVVSVPYHLEQ